MDWGPWDEFDVVDGVQSDDVVGICRKDDPTRTVIFTPQDMESLPNPLLDDPESSVRLYERNNPGKVPFL